MPWPTPNCLSPCNHDPDGVRACVKMKWPKVEISRDATETHLIPILRGELIKITHQL